ncbi:MAG: GNAT family N-acetyltransferase [Rhodobacter sp.]|nr:GNAT family N-acetyltransferase [Rhodobacter sp.]
MLETPRLRLRPHVMDDFEGFAAFLASDRAVHMGGPHPRDTAWSWFASDVAQWPLLGWGGLAITDRTTGEVNGQIAVIQPPRWPEPELGWLIYEGAEGRGLAQEAAAAMRDWALGPRGLPTLVSYVDPANTRSAALAERLGAVRDDAALRPHPEDLVFRHPAPQPLA